MGDLVVTDPGSVTRAPSQVVLSIFSGAGLLDRAFELEGFCVVSLGDLLWGQDIRSKSVPPGRFDGVIGGPPCQDFSKARRCPPSGNGVAMLAEFARVVTEAQPEWWLCENVPAVPDVTIRGYIVQRFNLNAKEVGLPQNRNRRFQFGSRDGRPLVIVRSPPRLDASHAALASEGKRSVTVRRTWEDFCELQGLPRTFTLPSLTKAGRYQAVGNGVPIEMGRVISQAVVTRYRVTAFRLCACECGQPVHGKASLASPACRKRMQRKRDTDRVTEPGPVTPATSLFDVL